MTQKCHSRHYQDWLTYNASFKVNDLFLLIHRHILLSTCNMPFKVFS